MLELIVHNISHSDMVLGIATPGQKSTTALELVARPKFSCFKEISQLVYDNLCKGGNAKLDHIQSFSRNGATSPLSQDEFVPVGYTFNDSAIQLENTKNLRVKAMDNHQISLDENEPVNINGVYFPLVATLLQKWDKITKAHNSTHFQKIIILVSGKGQPQDEKAQSTNNSTKYVGKLISLFIRQVYPDIQVQQLHSHTNLFRYDENIVFVKKELLPTINHYRDELAEKYGTEWRSKLHLTLSFADGSTARISAISASLRHFRPSYMHFWVLKTFWRERRISEDDIEWHTNEEIATNPAISLRDVSDDRIKMVLEEMQRFKQAFLSAANPPNAQDSDLLSFWLRKTKKPVLAVLLIEKPGEKPKLYRGTNMEVSMPTGSLCAERNVIGTALADDVGLLRQDIKFIAVYSVLLGRSADAKIIEASASPALQPPYSPSLHAKRKIMHMNSIKREYSEEKIRTPHSPLDHEEGSVLKYRRTTEVSSRVAVEDKSGGLVQRSISFTTPTIANSNEAEQHSAHCNNIFFKTSITVEEGDLNPLKPCGVCNEWLKKIAEVNPQFQIVTFTDANCNGIYCEPVTEF